MVPGGQPRLVVGVGASAGGLDASKRLLEAMPPASGLAFIVVMHLDPSHESHAARLLAATTQMTVVQASDTQLLEPNHVYVIAPDRELTVRGGVLRSSGPRKPHGQRKPVDTLLSSLAADMKERAVGIILSGTGNNGSAGIRDLRAQGGLCLVQDPATAQYDGMPTSAIATGVAHHVLAPEAMPKILLAHAEQPEHPTLEESQAEVRQESGPSDSSRQSTFDSILELLGRAHGVNFRTDYKRATLERRIQRRMAFRNISDWQAYRQVLDREPGEVAALYRDVLIGVTGFFRDPDVWAYLAAEVIPRLLGARKEGETLPVKVWVPACATGEEAYSLAILFLEQLEALGRSTRLQIFATDVAESALAVARRGTYPPEIQTAITPERLARFFVREVDGYRVGRQVRETVTFACHNLLADPPFSQMDLVSCRNLLIYLEVQAQQKALELFHFALKPDRILLLGASETVGRHGDLFESVSDKASVYRARPLGVGARRRLLHWPAQRASFLTALAVASLPPAGPRVNRIVEQMVLARHAEACVAVSESFDIQSFFGPTQDYLVQPTGEARMDLLAWVKPGLYSGLRAGLADAVARRETVRLTNLHVERDGVLHDVECSIEPITPLPGDVPLFLVVFRDATAVPVVELRQAAQQPEPMVAQLEAELRHAREELRVVAQHFENTSEEYRASHEEMVSLNEELQLNNEELEASKEELQSLNEEMVTVNRQSEDTNIELRRASADLSNLLVSADIPIVFLDREFRVRRYTPAATELLRLVSSDVGRSIEHIKERFRDGGLIEDARKVLETLAPTEVEVETEEGRWYLRRLLPYRTEEGRIDGVCIAFYDMTESKRAARQVDEARAYAESIVATVRTSIMVLGRDLRVVSVNDSFCDTFGVPGQEAAGQLVYELGGGQWNISGLRELLERVLPEELMVSDFEVAHEFKGLGPRTLLLNARLMHLNGRPDLILLAIDDITQRKATEELVKTRAEELAQEHRRKDEFLAMLGHELRNPLSALIHGLDLLELAPEDLARGAQIQGMMRRQARRIASLLEQLLDVARVTAGKEQVRRTTIDLSVLVRGAVEPIMPLIEASKHDLVVSVPPDGSVMVRGDFARLSQVVENLLTNAAKYTEKGGRIELSVDAEGPTARIRVRDNGIGIDGELLPHVFELFTQAPRTLERAAGGLGLGLPLVRRVVEMHGGTVEASSAGPGQGSEFVVTLPRMLERYTGQDSIQVAAAQGAALGSPLRILVVDDEADAALMLAELLAAKGFESRVAHDGPAALEVAASFHPQVVLLDLGLPKMNGYEIAKRLRQDHAYGDLMLIALSGYQSDRGRLKEAGFDHHLLKPPDMRTLFGWLGAESTRRARPN